jgi:ubiquinone/menaquinone biosynthesis C-methylase UbiE
MDHHDHVELLRPAHLPNGGTWADLGAGAGAFTLALRELIGPEAIIYAVDREAARLRELERNFLARFGNSPNLRILHGDFTRPLPVAELEGVLMANSLHFYKDKLRVLQQVGSLLKPNGVLLVVEYNVDSGNLWVPYPLSFERFRGQAMDAGYEEPRLLGTHPSSFLRGFYSALTFIKKGTG